MINESHPHADIAKAELERRGTVTPDMDLSGHAIDRASQRLLSVWVGTRTKDEGLYSWLYRKAKEALEKGEKIEEGVYLSAGIKFVFEMDGEWPVLVTVMTRGEKRD